MAIEVMEERPQERRFIVTRDGMPLWRGGSELPEPELRELVEKGAKALGLENATYTLSTAHDNRVLIKENTRLRAWLERAREVLCDEHELYAQRVKQLKVVIKWALAGEKAPGA